MYTQLKILRAIESKIVRREPAPVTLGNLNFDIRRVDQPSEAKATMSIVDVIDYRIHIGARARVQERAAGEARKHLCKIFARHMLGDLREELLDLREFLYLQGHPFETIARVDRLIRLVEGDEV